MLLSQDCHLAASNCKMPLISKMLKCGRTHVLKYPADGPMIVAASNYCLNAWRLAYEKEGSCLS